jgi:hypothetical protein
MRIYVSGKRTGAPPGETAEKFAAAEGELAGQGHETVNPLRCSIPAGYETLSSAVNILALIGCEAIYLLPDWERCELATLEKEIAEATGKQVIYRKNREFEALKDVIRRVTGVPFCFVAGSSRRREYVYARMIFAHYAGQSGATVERIACELNRNHSTVTYYLQKFDDEVKVTQAFSRTVAKMDEILYKTENRVNKNSKN